MKKNSVPARFVIAFLFVINALGHSSARYVLGQKGIQNELEVTRINSMFAQKETSHRSGVPYYYHVRKLGLGGKKSMVAHKESSMVFSMNEKGSDGRGTSKISAEEGNDALKKPIGSLREGVDQKENETKLGQPKASELPSYVIPMSASGHSNTNSNSQVKARMSSSTRPERQTSEEPQAHEDEVTASQKDEEKTRDLFQAEEEIVNLIHKDYKGMARRKPPINNQEPGN